MDHAQASGSLKYRQFKIVGFVRSSEYLDRSDIGQTTVGTGQLSGVAVVKKSAFKTGTAYAIARVTYNQTAKMNPYSSRYTNYVEKQQQQLKKALNRHGKTKQQKLERQLKTAQQQLTQATQQAAVFQQTNAAGNSALIQQAAALKKQQAKLKQLGTPTYTLSDRTENPAMPFTVPTLNESISWQRLSGAVVCNRGPGQSDDDDAVCGRRADPDWHAQGLRIFKCQCGQKVCAV